MKWRAIWQTPKDAVYNFFLDNGLTLAAALAFYALLSIAPLLILLITVFGLVGDSTEQRIIAQTEKLIGPQASQGIELIVKNAKAQRFAATAPALAGLVVLLLSATSAFGQLQSSLNTIFNIRWKRGILMGWLYKRFLSLLMVLALGVVLVAAVVLSSAVAVVFRGNGRTAQIIDLILSVVVFTVIFVIVYRVLPDIKISWRDTWVGGLVTSLLFVAGEYGISEYLRAGGTTSVYGAAAALVVLLLWIYYSSIILFLGAELTQTYAEYCGHGIVPDERAEWDPETARRLRQKQEQAQEARTGGES